MLRAIGVWVSTLFLHYQPVTLHRRAAPAPDSTLAALLAPPLFDSLRGAGSRADMLWVAGDARTSVILASVARLRRIHLTPPHDSLLPCPGSTDSTGALLRGPTGYHVFIRTLVDAASTLFVQARVQCRELYRGRRPRGFAEGMTWEATKDARGWHLGRLRDHFIT
jgi:hypothetical protein